MISMPCDPLFRPVRFELLADAEPGLLPRAIAPFARRNLVPDMVRAQRQGSAMLVEIRMEAMPSEMLHLVEGNLRQIVGVQRLVVVLCAAQKARPRSSAIACAINEHPDRSVISIYEAAV